MKLINEIRKCTHCAKKLPLGPNPIVQFTSKSPIVVVGQAPGVKVHQSGIPWDDASGERLREWLGVESIDFYNTAKFGIVPMGFCYPGKGKSGDLPPRPECAELWMDRVFKALKGRVLVLLVGLYAQKYFLKDDMKKTLTETVRSWEEFLPEYFVLPHPSPRNNIWLSKNNWFNKKTIPDLKKKVNQILR